MAIIKTKKADLNIHHKKYFQISIIITLCLLIAAFKFSPNGNIPIPPENNDPGWIDLQKTVKTKQLPKPPLPSKPPLPKIEVSDIIDDIIVGPTDINQNDRIAPPPDLPIPSSRIIEDDNSEFRWVEEMPTLIGGIQSIQKNIYYTEIARRIEVEGKVIIEFVVNKQGEVEDAFIFKGIFDELDKIALNAVQKARFTPALQRGKAVRVRMWMPIIFRLK